MWGPHQGGIWGFHHVQVATQNVLQGLGSSHDPARLCLYSVRTLGKRGGQSQSLGIRPASCVLRISVGIHTTQSGHGESGGGAEEACWRLAYRLRKDRELSELRTQRSRGTNEADSPYSGWAPRKGRFRWVVSGFRRNNL